MRSSRFSCAPKAANKTIGNPTPNVQQSSATPTPDKFGVVKAGQWAEEYPYEYQSYLENASYGGERFDPAESGDGFEYQVLSSTVRSISYSYDPELEQANTVRILV